MTRTTVDAGGRRYTVSRSEPPLPGHRYQGLVLAQLVDELTTHPVRTPVTVTLEPGARGVRPATGLDGVAGLAGVPARTFPSLDTTAYPLTVLFRAEGYTPLRHRVELPAQPQFPAQFVGVDLGALPAHRPPVTVLVRVLDEDLAPVPGATVEVTGIWRDLPSLATAAAPLDPDLVAVLPACYADRPHPGAVAAPVTLTPVAEPARHLARAVAAGARELPVDRAAGLAAGAVVAVDAADPDRAEHLLVDRVEGPSDPESPALAVLALPLATAHAAGVAVGRVTPSPAGPDVALTAAAATGDVTVLVADPAPLAAAPVARLSGGPAPAEYVTVRPYRALTDAEGYARLPPLSRVAAVELTAAAGPLTTPPARHTLDHRMAENHLSLTFDHI